MKRKADENMRGLLLCVCICAIVTAVSCGGKQKGATDRDAEARAVPVTVSKAVIRTVAMESSTTGDIRAFADASVISEVAGVIESLPAERGQKVKAGDLIAIVEHAEASAAVRQAEAALQAARALVLQAEAGLLNLEGEFGRVRELFDAATASKRMLDDISSKRDVAAAAREAALAQVAQAKAALEQTRVFLSNHTVRAPIAGVITARFVDEGDKNNPEAPIVSIAQVEPLKVLCDFAERDVALLDVGQAARLRVDAYPNEMFSAQVAIISPVVDPATRTLEVELHASSGGGRLRPGMFAWVTVIGDKAEMLTVPGDALNRIPGTGTEFVYVVDGDSARRVDVVVGRRVGQVAEISGGIRPGDRVVVEGQTNLKSGGRVRVVSEAESES